MRPGPEESPSLPSSLQVTLSDERLVRPQFEVSLFCNDIAIEDLNKVDAFKRTQQDSGPLAIQQGFRSPLPQLRLAVCVTLMTFHFQEAPHELSIRTLRLRPQQYLPSRIG